jgi:hypothetical protein
LSKWNHRTECDTKKREKVLEYIELYLPLKDQK